MTPADTSMGGWRESFPATRWSLILGSREAAPAERQAGLSELLSRYWRPVYRYVRASWGRSIEDAKDQTQEFFCHIIEADLVGAYRPDRGRFRHFLKGALKNFLAQSSRNEQRQKRGGGRTIVPLDVAEMERDPALADSSAQSPDEIFERQWASDVLAQSLRELQEQLAAEGKSKYYDVYLAYEVAPDSASPTYESIAQRLGLSVFDVRNYLNLARARLHDLILKTVSDSVSTPEELEAEMRELFPG